MRNYTVPLQAILTLANTALTEEGRGPGRAELTPGLQPAWDDCCGGQLYLRTIEVFPTMGKNSPFPAIDTQQSGTAGGRCALHMLAVHIGLGVIRCAATVKENGDPPTPEEVSADADVMLKDMATLLEVLVCQAQDTSGITKLAVDRWMPSGPEGGCTGGEWSAYVAVDPCLCKVPSP